MADGGAGPEAMDAGAGAPPPRRVKLCPACSTPVAAFGRLSPCRHAFCTSCATGHPLCFLCQSTIARVDRVEPDGLYISPITLESFTSASEFEAHLAGARSRLGPIRVVAPAPPPLAAAMPGQQQQFHPAAMRPPGQAPPLPAGGPPVLALPPAPFGWG